MNGLTRKDSVYIASLREAFNDQPIYERFRIGRFMTYEAVIELLREHEHAANTVARIEKRIATILDAARRRDDDLLREGRQHEV